jgi:hypothetical protein
MLAILQMRCAAYVFLCDRLCACPDFSLSLLSFADVHALPSALMDAA